MLRTVKEALKEQDEHLGKTYGFDPWRDRKPIDAADMNEQAAEAAQFMGDLAAALRAGTKASSRDVGERIRRHLNFLRRHGHDANPAAFAAQCRFFLEDDFHLNMLESQQIGLAYYLCAAAEAFAAGRTGRRAGEPMRPGRQRSDDGLSQDNR